MTTIPAAPAAAPMWEDRRSFAEAVRSLTFHEDDVPSFDVVDLCDLLRELLVEEFGWDAIGSHAVRWGDSGSLLWTVRVTLLASGVVVDVYDGVGGDEVKVSFSGEPRRIAPRVLAYLASNTTA